MREFGFLSQFYRDLKAQRLRTVLTLFGITWGIVAVVLLLAFGVGLYRHSLITVIGVLRKKVQTSAYYGMDSRAGFVPATTLRSTFGHRYVNNLVFRPKPGLSKEAIKKVYRVLGRKHRFDPEDKDALMIWDTTGIDNFLLYFFLGLNILLGVGGVCTLVVGGIGVANIMYVVIRERTGEIGIKMAVGAKPRHILSQFMLETFALVATGGTLGFGISWAIVNAATLLPDKVKEAVGTPVLSPSVALATVLGAVGYFPAKRAASIDPAEALRYE